MTKQEILAASGFDNEEDFYAAYPNPEDYFNSIGQTFSEDNSFAKGGWIQKATASIKRRGTEGVCTGSKFGGPSCRPGTRRYALAKTFRKMAKARKKEDGGMVDMYEDGGEMDAYQLMGMPTPEMYYMGGPTDYEPSYGSGVRSMNTEFNRGYAQGGFIGGPRPMFGRALVNEDGGELNMTDYGPYAYAYANGGFVPIPMFKRGGRFKKFLRKIGATAYGLGEGVLDTVTFGATDRLTDKGYKALQKIGGASGSEIREQDSLRGYGNIGGAVGGAILNPGALGSAISEGAEGLGEGVAKGSPNSRFAQSVGQWAPTVGNIAGMAVGSFKPSAGALKKAGKFAQTDFGKFAKTAKNIGKFYNMAEPTASNLLGGGRGQQPQMPQQGGMGQQGMYNQMPYGGGYGQGYNQAMIGDMGSMGGMNMAGLSRRDVRQMTKGLPRYMRRAARKGARRGDYSLLQGMFGGPQMPTAEQMSMNTLSSMAAGYNQYRRELGGELDYEPPVLQPSYSTQPAMTNLTPTSNTFTYSASNTPPPSPTRSPYSRIAPNSEVIFNRETGTMTPTGRRYKTVRGGAYGQTAWTNRLINDTPTNLGYLGDDSYNAGGGDPYSYYAMGGLINSYPMFAAGGSYNAMPVEQSTQQVNLQPQQPQQLQQSLQPLQPQQSLQQPQQQQPQQFNMQSMMQHMPMLGKRSRHLNFRNFSPLGGLMNKMVQPGIGRKLGRAGFMGLGPSLMFGGKRAMGGAINYPEGLQMNTYAEGGEESSAPEFKDLKTKYNSYLTAQPVTKYFSKAMPPHPKDGSMDPRGTVVGGMSEDGGPVEINVESQEANWKMNNGGNFITMNNNKGKLSTANALKHYNNNDKLALAAVFNNTERRKAKLDARSRMMNSMMNSFNPMAMPMPMQDTSMMGRNGGMLRKFGDGTDPFDAGNVTPENAQPEIYSTPYGFGDEYVPSYEGSYNPNPALQEGAGSSGGGGEGGGNFWGAVGSALPYALQLAPALFNIREGLRKPTQVNIDTSLDPELGLIDARLPEIKIKGEAGRKSITDATKDALALQKYAWRQAGGQGGQAPLIAGTNAAMQAQARALRQFEENLANAQSEADFKKALSEAELKRYNAMTQFEKRKFRLNAELSKYGLQAEADAVPSQYMSAGLSNLGQFGNQIIYNQMLKNLYSNKEA